MKQLLFWRDGFETSGSASTIGIDGIEENKKKSHIFSDKSTYPDSWNITRYFPSELLNLAWTQ